MQNVGNIRFHYRETLCVKRGASRRPVSVCLSVCHTLVYCIQVVEDIIKLFSRIVITVILVYFEPKRCSTIPRWSWNPVSGELHICVFRKICNFRPICPYIL